MRNKYIAKTITLFIYTLVALIATLLITGGYHTPKLEIAQVNVFGIILVCFCAVFMKLRGQLFPNGIKKFATSIETQILKYDASKALGIALIAFVFFWVVFQLLRFYTFQTNAFDFGFIDHAVWSTAVLYPKTPLLHSTISRNGTYFSEHFSPILLFFVPFYKLWAHPFWLFFWNAFWIGSGSLFIFKISKHYKLSQTLGLFFALSYFFLPSVKGALGFDPREDLFFIPLIFGMVLSLLQNKKSWFWFCFLVSFLVKENAPIVTALIGIWAITLKRKNTGIAAILISVVWFAFLNKTLMPMLSGTSQTVMAGRLSFLGDTPRAALENLFLHPIHSFIQIFQIKLGKNAFKYFMAIWLPFLSLWAVSGFQFKKRSLGLFSIAALLTGMNLLITPQMIGFHYELIVLPFLMTWAIESASTISKPENDQKGLIIGVFVLSILVVFGRSPVLTFREYFELRKLSCFEAITSKIPEELSVRTTSALHPHLTHRAINLLFNNSTDLNEDIVLISEYKNMSLYATDHIDERLTGISNRGYKNLISTPMISIWCKSQTCDKYSATLLSAVLQGVECFEKH